ncbi:MAG: dTDP-4-dehydrorhamnose reductase [bacterium]|nr:dTDP-4-dehydrorhamnose reductase [bacterium]
MKKVLVTGAYGMLGKDLCPILRDNGYDVFETDIHNLDITKTDSIEAVFSVEKPDIVIHCAGYTNVDKAEEDYETAKLINVQGTENIAKAVKKYNAVMVYISTDYVFDGKAQKPYVPSDVTNPINKYGLTKRDGEVAVTDNLEKYYICRTSWLYGYKGKNFVETMLSFADKPELKVVDDQVGCPTYTVDLSKAIIKTIENKPYGIYHTCGGGSTSWYGFAKEIFKLAAKDVNLKPCLTDEFPRAAKRPAYSIMDNGGICRDWKEALKDYFLNRTEV